MDRAPFRWGILGTGGIARSFARDIATLGNHEVLMVGSRDSARSHSFAEEIGAKSFGSYEDVIHSSLDAIYVATPHSSHASNALAALNAGKPVLVEKPFAVNAQEAREMIAKSREKSLPLMEAMWSRFLPHYKLIRTIIDSGELGDLIYIFADHGQALPRETHYRLHAPELAGGALLDMGIYPVSFASMIFGKPLSILAKANFTESGVDSQTSALLTYEEGRHALITTNLLVRTPCIAQIVGTKGRVEISGRFYAPTDVRTVIAGNVKDYPNSYQGHGIREEALAFENLVRSNRIEHELMPHSETLKIMETMDEIRAQIGLHYPFERDS